MRLALVLSADSNARIKASVAGADARVLAADGRPFVRSDVRIVVDVRRVSPGVSAQIPRVSDRK